MCCVQKQLTEHQCKQLARSDNIENIIIALSNYGMLLYLINYEYRTETICLLAVKKNGMAIEHVPFEKLSYQICIEAIKECFSAFHILYNLERYSHKVPNILYDEQFKSKCYNIISKQTFIDNIRKSTAFKNMVLLNKNNVIKIIKLNQVEHLVA